jgi:hypothetical protein
MTTAADLLHNAYEYIDAGNFHYASAILESLINIDPMNIEAWEACMQISRTCEELDYLCEQVLQIPELNSIERESILDYYYFLRQKMRAHGAAADTPKLITYELVNQFTSSLRDQPSTDSNDFLSRIDFERGLTWLLNKAISTLYLILLLIGLKLVSLHNNFGYWILMVLIMSIFVGLWNMVFPIAENNRMPDSNQLETTDALDKVSPLS